MFKIILGWILFTSIYLSNACAIETISVTRGIREATPIAINDFNYEGQDRKIAGDIISVISKDLENSGLFKPVPKVAFIESRVGIKHEPLFAAWRQINANLLLNGEVKRLSPSKIQVSFILWDNFLQKISVAESIQISSSLWRRGAHKIADKIYEKITGDKGYFDTRMTYVSESGPALKRIRRLALMDYDGENHQFLTDGNNIVMTPKFSPKADKILYVSYYKNFPRIMLRNLLTGKDTQLKDLKGVTFAPRFSPDGTKALVSIARMGSTHIYEVDLHTLNKTRLTSGIGINTSPSYSPDGRRIVFNSDRNGSRQLYIMNSDGSGVERISFGDGKYACPSWSPRGDHIAFIKIAPDGDRFAIGIMKTSGEAERTLTTGYLLENPVWAPNGRVIMFTKGFAPKGKNGFRYSLYSIDLTGYNEKIVPTPRDASYGDWSKNL